MGLKYIVGYTCTTAFLVVLKKLLDMLFAWVGTGSLNAVLLTITLLYPQVKISGYYGHTGFVFRSTNNHACSICKCIYQ